ncbi:MazG-like family protein [Paraclostridium bifermentans]|nr:MazG-like family protein [Paraclostridium bifermentans]
MRLDKNSEITKNIKIIEWMKTELIISLGDLFNLLFKGTRPVDQILQDTLAIYSYGYIFTIKETWN